MEMNPTVYTRFHHLYNCIRRCINYDSETVYLEMRSDELYNARSSDLIALYLFRSMRNEEKDEFASGEENNKNDWGQ